LAQYFLNLKRQKAAKIAAFNLLKKVIKRRGALDRVQLIQTALGSYLRQSRHRQHVGSFQ